jgi:hypothetical protein
MSTSATAEQLELITASVACDSRHRSSEGVTLLIDFTLSPSLLAVACTIRSPAQHPVDLNHVIRSPIIVGIPAYYHPSPG